MRRSMNRWRPRQVLECASLLALWRCRRANRKRQRTGAVQDAAARSEGSWSQCMRKNETGLSMNRRVLPASCRQSKLTEVLPTRRRQHLVGCTARAASCSPIFERAFTFFELLGGDKNHGAFFAFLRVQQLLRLLHRHLTRRGAGLGLFAGFFIAFASAFRLVLFRPLLLRVLLIGRLFLLFVWLIGFLILGL